MTENPSLAKTKAVCLLPQVWQEKQLRMAGDDLLPSSGYIWRNASVVNETAAPQSTHAPAQLKVVWHACMEYKKKKNSFRLRPRTPQQENIFLCAISDCLVPICWFSWIIFFIIKIPYSESHLNFLLLFSTFIANSVNSLLYPHASFP